MEVNKIKAASLFDRLKQIREEPKIDWSIKVNETLKTRPISYSSLKNFYKSPQHYLDYLYGEKKETDAFTKGNVFECMLLEPELIDEKVAIMPSFNLRTNQGKADKEAFATANKGKEIIKEQDFEDCLKMYDNAIKDDDVMRLVSIKKGIQETIFWTDRETGIRNISKLDFTAESGDVPLSIVDVKTSASGELDDFMRAVIRFDYVLQTGSYRLAYKNTKFQFPDYYWIVAETTAPFGVNVVKADSKLIDAGERAYEQGLLAFKYCRDKNLWNQSYSFFRFNMEYYSGNLPGYYNRKL